MRKLIKNVLSLLSYSVLTAMLLILSSVNSIVKAESTDENETEVLDFNNINTFAQYEFKGDFQYWVKFSILVDAQGELQNLLIQNSNKFKFHADYLALMPAFKGLTKNQINELTIHKKGRRAYVGTLFFTALENTKAAFEIIANEQLELTELTKIQTKLKKAAPELVKDLAFMPQPQFRNDTITNSKLYNQSGIKLWIKSGNTNDVCYAEGSGFGRIQLVYEKDYTQKLKSGLIGPQDIIVSDRLPRDIVPVAGIIIEQESSPSSHGALLGQMMGFPVVYQNEALKNWSALDEKFVFINARGSASSCVVQKTEVTNTKAIEKILDLKRPLLSNVKPSLNESITEITSVKKLSYLDVAKIGGKAANMTRLLKILPAENVPQAAIIPVSFYRRYIQESKAPNGERLIDFINNQLKSIAAADTSMAKVLEVAQTIREALNRAEISEKLVNEIRTQLLTFFPDNKIRLKFRSSSNVEDLKSFNGAGLYDSKGVCPADNNISATKSVCDPSEKPDPIEKALHKVWSSLYNDRAYLARRYLAVDESTLAMAILVQASIRNELANGVAILDRDKNSGDLFATITGFPGEDLEVVHPPAGKVPETTQVNINWNKKISYEILVPSTELPTSRSLLASDEYESLYLLMAKVMQNWDGPKPDALDFEWKLVAENGMNKIVVKQVREVPSGNIKKEAKLDDIIWLVRNENSFQSYFGESSFGLAAMKGNVKIEIKASYFSLADLKKGQSNIEQLKLTTIDGVYNYAGKDLKVNVRTTPWETITPPGQVSGAALQRRTNDIRIALPNPVVPSLELAFEVAELKSTEKTDSSRDVQSRIRIFSGLNNDNWASQYLNFSAKSSDFLDNKDRINVDEDYRWTANDPIDAYYQSENPTYDASENFKNTHMTISLQATTNYGGFDKTMFKKISQATITGLLSKPIIVKEAKALVYAPAHHNFGWEYVIDLSKLESSDQALQNELVNLKARYLVISSVRNDGNHVTLWSDKAKIKDLGLVQLATH
jgi:hypothetical protein